MKTYKNISALLVAAVACTLLSSCTIYVSEQETESPAPRYGLYVPSVSTSTHKVKYDPPPGSCTRCTCKHYVAKKCNCAFPPCVVCGHSSKDHR